MTEQQTTAGRELVAPTAHPRLEITQDQTWWTEAQQAALAAIGLDKVPQGDAVAYLHLCQRTGLDPFAREIHLVGRKDSTMPSGMKYSAQTGIDGYRHVAERTGQFRGTEGPWFCGPDGQWSEVWFSDEPPVAAKAVVKRLIDGEIVRTEAVAMYREFVAMKPEYKDNRRTGRDLPAAMWAKMPAHMTGKCAEALAYRRAFPRQLNGTYIAEELVKADVDSAEQERAELAAAREQTRREYVRRPWADKGPAGSGEPANLADTAPGDVVEGEATEKVDEVDAELIPSVEELHAELAEIAAVLDTTPAALANRAVKLHRRNLEDFDADQLLTLVEAYREQAAQTAQERTQGAVEALAEEKGVPAPEEPAEPAESDEERIAREALHHQRAKARAAGAKSTESAAERAARHAAEAAVAEEPPGDPTLV